MTCNNLATCVLFPCVTALIGPHLPIIFWPDDYDVERNESRADWNLEYEIRQVEIPGEDWSNKVAITGDTKAKSMREQPKSFFLLLLLRLLLPWRFQWGTQGSRRRRRGTAASTRAIKLPLIPISLSLSPSIHSSPFFCCCCVPLFSFFFFPLRVGLNYFVKRRKITQQKWLYTSHKSFSLSLSAVRQKALDSGGDINKFFLYFILFFCFVRIGWPC